MESKEMMVKMTITCRVLNDVLRDQKKYDELKHRYQKLEEIGKMNKMNDLYNLCEKFGK
ncbi:hypothetical protein OAJ83_00140 [Candidatus Nitrosopelagicus sp.]|nr:hypothetical protein [Candidatus Nitrosopelagicus sp.]|tara:strand:- start:290 stop:466 length:177 start_codon:yes stop_codon:yes gene_type:complete